MEWITWILLVVGIISLYIWLKYGNDKSLKPRDAKTKRIVRKFYIIVIVIAVGFMLILLF